MEVLNVAFATDFREPVLLSRYNLRNRGQLARLRYIAEDILFDLLSDRCRFFLRWICLGLLRALFFCCELFNLRRLFILLLFIGSRLQLLKVDYLVNNLAELLLAEGI